jgi:hypothetical protein
MKRGQAMPRLAPSDQPDQDLTDAARRNTRLDRVFYAGHFKL